MTKLVVIHLGNGDLDKGFEQVTAQLWEVGNPFPEQFIGSLPPAPELLELYKNWQSSYHSLSARLRSRSPDDGEDDELEIDVAGITNISENNFNDLSEKLHKCFNDWFKSVEFLNIDRKLRSALNPTEEIRVIIETRHIFLRRLPWYDWDFFHDYPKSEMALSQLEYKRIVTSKQSKNYQKKVRILAVIGNSQGINSEAETRLLQSLQDADVKFLFQPSRATFNSYLWDSQGWNILFFAGHSKTQGKKGRIYLNEDETNNSLTIEELKEALKKSIEKDLNLAIFNSCDGLGLADELQKLHIPTVIVMREPVPNIVAQEFFQYFLQYFAIERLTLYLAFQQARKKLQGLEGESPGASWLPVICQNPAVEPPTWRLLGGSIPPCPYRGLSAFKEEHTHLFFGREQFITDLVVAVNTQTMVAVVGASGSGKSSVVFAGLVPHLRQDTDVRWHIADFRPGNKPWEALAASLAPIIASSMIETKKGKFDFVHEHSRRLWELDVELDLLTKLRQSHRGLYEIVDNFVECNSGDRLVIIVDQFEELYTQTPAPERQLFLDALLTCVKLAPAFTLVITLRADFYGYALSYRPLSDALQGAVFNLGPMSREELQSVIEQPAALVQVGLEPGLTNKLIDRVHGQAGGLPLLEFALFQLWSKQHQDLLTHQAYSQIGGVEKALANHAEKVYSQISTKDKYSVQRIFMQLVRLREDTEATRRLATRHEIGEENWNLVINLADNRLVVTNHNEFTQEETAEIVHEALIKSWGRLEQWLQVDGEFRHWQDHLRSAMGTWQNSGRDEGALLRGKLLIDAQDWLSQRRQELSLQERKFIQHSLELRSREFKNRKRIRQFTIITLTISSIVALMLASLAGWQWQNALKNEIQAMSMSAKALLTSNDNFEALIAAIEAKVKLQNLLWIDADTKNQALRNLEQAVHRVAEHNRLLGHSNSVWAVACSPNGKIIASASADKTIKLWNRDGSLIRTLKGHDSSVWAIIFSPDGQTIVSASADKTIKLWNLDGKQLRTFNGHGNTVNSVAFSSDGKLIASASADKTIKIWNLDGKQLRTFNGHGDKVNSVAFSPDGKLIVSASADKTIKLWNLDGKQLRSFNGHGDRVNSVAFSPDGKLIVSASTDKTIKLWNLDGKQLKTFRGHDDVVWTVTFSPDSKTIVSGSWDNTIKLWSTNGQLLRTLNSHRDRVRGIAFSPNGKTIVSASEDKTVKLWKLNNSLLNILHGHGKPVIAIRFSPDGQTIASASDDKTIKLWNRDGSLQSTLEGHTAGVLGLAFSPDGQTIASASDDKTIKLWNRDGSLRSTFKGHTDAVWQVAFSPDGNTIASASDDKTVKLWSIEGKLIKTLKRHNNEARGVAFSPDGKFIASASVDATVKLWKSDGTFVREFKHNNSPVLAVAFSPDNQSIASASWDNTIKLWSIGGKLENDFSGESENLRGISFSPNGKIIASAGGDSTIKLWKTDGTLLRTLRGHSRGLREVSFSPDGKTIASASEDKTVILWNREEVLKDPLESGCKWVKDYWRNNGKQENL